jgi:flavin-dependent dehydrogenase
VPNYGVWLEEWHALDDLLDIGLRGCLSRTWPTTDCFYGGSHGLPESDRLRIERPYARVARDAMRSTLLQRMAAAGVTRVQAGVDAANVQHGPDSSTFQLLGQSGAAAEGVTVEARLIVDCSGHKSEVVERDGVHDPGYQIAYGIECEVEGASLLLQCCIQC